MRICQNHQPDTRDPPPILTNLHSDLIGVPGFLHGFYVLVRLGGLQESLDLGNGLVDVLSNDDRNLRVLPKETHSDVKVSRLFVYPLRKIERDAVNV